MIVRRRSLDDVKAGEGIACNLVIVRFPLARYYKIQKKLRIVVRPPFSQGRLWVTAQGCGR
jgi:hypothetical protein